MEWTKARIHETIEKQREFFLSGETLPVSGRIEALKKLRNAVETNSGMLEDALHQDLGRHSREAYFCDIGSTIMEINEIIHSLKRWAKPELHFSGLTCFPSMTTRVYKMPYGVTLIISPFNFPILLSL